MGEKKRTKTAQEEGNRVGKKKCHGQGVEGKGANNREKSHIRGERQIKNREGQQERGINEVFFVPPVVVIGRHGVPVETITGPSGKRQGLCGCV